MSDPIVRPDGGVVHDYDALRAEITRKEKPMSEVKPYTDEEIAIKAHLYLDEEDEDRLIATIAARDAEIAKLKTDLDGARSQLFDAKRAFGGWAKKAVGCGDVVSKLRTDYAAAAARIAVLEDALYPLVVGCFEADAREDAPEFVNGEGYNGARALPQCERCDATGATDKKHYEDMPIPADVLCPDCGGWGFLKHPILSTPSAQAVLAAEAALAKKLGGGE